MKSKPRGKNWRKIKNKQTRRRVREENAKLNNRSQTGENEDEENQWNRKM